jgi:signal transduction histidine kinase
MNMLTDNPASSIGQESTPPGQCLLVVDDEPNNLSIMVDYLRAYGFDIMTARTGSNGLSKAVRGHPDLILLDIMLPDIDGFEVCRRLQSDANTKDIPVIFLTALTQMEDKLKGFEAGGVDYLTKPIQEAEVLARVTTHLKLRNLQMRLHERNRALQQEIEQRVRVEEELRQAKFAAEQANRAKSIFLANMSHEIRTPLNAVLGFSEILAAALDNPRHKEYLHAIQVSGQTLLDIINDILDLAKIEAGKLEVIYREVDPRPIFTDMAVIFSQKLGAKNIQFSVDISPDLPHLLRLDETRLRQILLNLVGNAVKFTHHGFIKLKVWCHILDSHSLDLYFSVQDNGIGIAPGEQEKIFAAFEQSRTRDTKEQGGTGLGLSIVKRLLEIHHGEISLDSAEGQGSTFSVRLRHVKIVENAPAKALPALKFAPATLLLFNALEENRQLLREYLQPYGFSFSEAASVAEACQLAAAQPPALIVLDGKHPLAANHSDLEQLKSAPETAALPLLLISAALPEEIAALPPLYEAVLGKPLHRPVLEDALKHFLRHNQASPPPLDLPALLAEHLRTHIAPRWRKLDRNASINEIEAFALDVLIVAQEYGYAPLTAWAERLQNQAALFNMDSLFQTLADFSAFISPP